MAFVDFDSRTINGNLSDIINSKSLMNRRRMLMKWSQVRQHFPNSIVLVEALKSETRGNERMIEEISVIDNFENGNTGH